MALAPLLGAPPTELLHVSAFLSGDGTIVARVLTVSPSSTGGIMIRDSLNANAMSIFESYFNSQMYSSYRTSTGGTTSQVSSATLSLPYWVKLVRSGSTFGTYTSLDGVNWTQFGTNQTIPMGQNIYVGLGVSSGNTASLATATFDSVSISSTAVPAPVITSISSEKRNYWESGSDFRNWLRNPFRAGAW